MSNRKPVVKCEMETSGGDVDHISLSLSPETLLDLLRVSSPHLGEVVEIESLREIRLTISMEADDSPCEAVAKRLTRCWICFKADEVEKGFCSNNSMSGVHHEACCMEKESWRKDSTGQYGVVEPGLPLG